MATVRILVVEDEAIVAMDIKNRLGLLGYAVAGSTGTGEEALALAATQRPDLVLMDVRLRGAMDGVAAAAELRRRFRVPVVFLTAYAEDSTLQRAKLAEPFGYILKPFEDRELKVVIEMALYRHRAEEELHRVQRLYAVLAQVNQAVVRLRSRDELFATACRIAVEYGGLSLAWVGLLDRATGRVVPVTHVGDDQGYLDLLDAHVSDPGDQGGLDGTAAGTGRPCVSNDFLSDPRLQPWHALAAAAGIRSGGAFPFECPDGGRGVLTLYAGEPGYFQEPEIHLLAEVAGDVAFALAKLADEARRQQAEEQARVAEAYYRSIVNTMPDGVMMCDLEGRVTFLSPRMFQIFQAPPTDPKLGSPVLDRMAPASRALAAEDIRRLLAGELPHALREYQLLRHDGTPFWAEISLARLSDAQGRPTGMLSVIRDVTVRKQAEEQLAFHHALLATQLEVAIDGVLVVDEQGLMLYHNQRFVTMWGVPPDALASRSGERLIQSVISNLVDPERFRARIAYLYEHRQETSQDEIALRDGRTFDRYSAPMLGPDGRYLGRVWYFRDITEHKQDEAELRDTSRRLAAALAELKVTQRQVAQEARLRALGQMASGIAHDFNNQLAVILGFGELLLGQPDRLADRNRLHQHLTMMVRAAKDAATVVDRMREFYRPRDAAEAVAALDLGDLVQQSVAMTEPRWRNQAAGAGAAIKIETELAPGAVITGNASELRQALTNLIFNAADAMPRGGTLTLGVSVHGEGVVLTVRDTGVGMTPEVLEHCLEPFFTTKAPGGSGLGLSVVHGIVRRHDATLRIASEVGHGTTVTIAFPPPTRPLRATAGGSPAAAVPPLRILVVDDEPGLRTLLTEALTADGHTVTTAGTGNDALAGFRAGHFDLVITDRAMPDMSGDQLGAAIKALAPRMPVIMLTGFGSLMKANGECPPGADSVIGKPVTQPELRAAILEVLRRAQAGPAGSPPVPPAP